ncbi:MAG TPA: hypothetical protein VGD22_00615 [Sphingobacteriaceae bacterium]
MWLPSVPEKISPSAGREPGKGHWLVSRRVGASAQEEARRQPVSADGEIAGSIVRQRHLGKTQEFIYQFFIAF